MTRLFDRPALRYRLWHLFAVLTVVSLLLGWYGYRLAYIQSEARAIAGAWVMVDERGNAVLHPSQDPFRLTLVRNQFSIDPYSEPRQIDFHTPAGTSKAIYRWERGRLHVLQESAGLDRPISFSDAITDLKVARPGTHSLSAYILQRSPK